jgi:hypothetical protein
MPLAKNIVQKIQMFALMAAAMAFTSYRPSITVSTKPNSIVLSCVPATGMASRRASSPRLWAMNTFDRLATGRN